jgi:hypothetical protein
MDHRCWVRLKCAAAASVGGCGFICRISRRSRPQKRARAWCVWDFVSGDTLTRLPWIAICKYSTSIAPVVSWHWMLVQSTNTMIGSSAPVQTMRCRIYLRSAKIVTKHRNRCFEVADNYGEATLCASVSPADGAMLWR